MFKASVKSDTIITQIIVKQNKGVQNSVNKQMQQECTGKRIRNASFNKNPVHLHSRDNATLRNLIKKKTGQACVAA